jgi:hypothetical protein
LERPGIFLLTLGFSGSIVKERSKKRWGFAPDREE